MRSLVLSVAMMAAVPGAFAAGRVELPAMIDAFVAEEVEGAGPERREAIAACLLAAFDGIETDQLASILDQEDFEDSLDALVKAYPDREDMIEACEEA